MKAIILAAGRGARLGEVTKLIPKCLLMLGSETILEREIRLLKECGFNEKDIFVVLGYKHEMVVERINTNIIINDRYNETDNSYSLGLALMALEHIDEEDILIIDGDLVFDKSIISAIITVKDPNVFLCFTSQDLTESTGIEVNDFGIVTRIGKDVAESGNVYVSIFKIGKKLINYFRTELLKESQVRNWYTNSLNKLFFKHKFVVNYIDKNLWHEIDTLDDYNETLTQFDL